MEQKPSPNFGPRPAGRAIDMVILHYTGMTSAERALDWLCDQQSGVSSHYFVFEDGHLVRLVEERDRAWHAGVSSWAGETDINSCSIGIEIANPGHEFGYRDFPLAQIEAVIDLCRDIADRHPVPPERMLAHSDVAPLRKEDPGERFPWRLLHEAGIGHWVAPAPLGSGPVLKLGDSGEIIGRLKGRFREYGYGLGETTQFDDETEAVVRAFQRHYRPARVDGVADRSTVTTFDRLIAGLPRRA